MNRNRTSILMLGLTVFTALIVFTAPGAFAISTNCIYNPETQMIEYSVSDGAVGQTYIVNLIASGCVAGSATPPTLTGPNDSDQIGVVCNGGDGFGTIKVEICDDVVCFKLYNLYFRCEADCELRYIGNGASSITDWGVLILLSLLTITGALFARKMFVTAK
ncbi:MAG: hypothetical protein ABIJ45_15015 [Candidatus Zixiibacteriota bacterium]